GARRRGLVSIPGRGRSPDLAAAGRAHLLAYRDGREPDQPRLRAAGAAVLRRRPQRCARVRPQPAGAGGVRRDLDRAGPGRHSGQALARFGAGVAHWRQYAGGRQRRAPAPLAHLLGADAPGRVRGRRDALGAEPDRYRAGAAPADARTRAPHRDAARARPARRRLQPERAPPRCVVQDRLDRRAHQGAGGVLGGSPVAPVRDSAHGPVLGRAAVLMRRRLARFVFVILLGTLAGILGVVTALVLTPPGRDLLARTVSSELSRVLAGSVEVGSVSGSFLYDLTIDGLVVRDTAGVLLADLPHVRIGYRLPNFLARRFVLARLQVERPTIQLIKHRNGRMNCEDVLRLGGPGGGTPPLIVFRGLEVRHGTLRILLPWSPAPQLKTEAERDSALTAERAHAGRVIETGPEGLRRVIEFTDLTTRIARMRISPPDHKPFQVDLDTLATRVSDPQIVVRDAAGRVRLHNDSVVFSLRRGALPHTRFTGGGAATWPHDTTLFDFQVVASQASLVDLRWISPDFPDLTGRGVVAARSESGTRTAFEVTDLHLARGPTRIDGQITALDDRQRGLGVRDLRLTHKDLDLAQIRPFVPGLPFFGILSGNG